YIDDIQQVIASGKKFAFLKAWEHTEDPSFRSRWAALKQDGLISGAYDFFHPGRDPIVQADGFLSTFGGILEDDDLPCGLDWEITDNVGLNSDLNNALAWLEYVEQRTKKTPGIYIRPNFVPLDSRFDRFWLWIANWGVKCPLVPAGR